MNEIKEQEFSWLSELKLFARFFIETYLLLIIIQLVSDKVDNNNINYYKEVRMALLVTIILYIAKCISVDMQQNISQGMHYAISGVFLSQYNV